MSSRHSRYRDARQQRLFHNLTPLLNRSALLLGRWDLKRLIRCVHDSSLWTRTYVSTKTIIVNHSQSVNTVGIGRLRRIQTSNGRASGPVAGGFLHSQLENFLADDDEPLAARGVSEPGFHGTGNLSARPISEGESNRATAKSAAFRLPHQTGATGRISGASRRFPAREPRDLERHVTPNRHRTRVFNRSRTCG